jgi:hypothetical protein
LVQSRRPVSQLYPCGDGSLEHPAALAFVGVDGGSRIDIADANYFASYIFGSCMNPPCTVPFLGPDCVSIEGCVLDICP